MNHGTILMHPAMHRNPAPVLMHCPKCRYVASARTEGVATRSIAAHLIAAHREPAPRVIGPSLPGAHAGQTWGDFLAAMNELGVTLDTEIASIEFGASQWGIGRICLEAEPDGVSVREVSREEVA